MARILVADDNALSLEFLVESIARIGHVADVARDGMETCQLASTRRYDLMIIDSRMPLRSGEDALRTIRAQPGPSREAMAVATTAEAELDPADLLRAGFSDVVFKPIKLENLRALLETCLATTFQHDEMLSDGLAMAKIGGDAHIMNALRGLLATELDALPDELNVWAVSDDTVALRERLHKLDASAGFCGAVRLAAATQELRRALDVSGEWPVEAIKAFLDVSAETRDSLV